MAIFYRSYKNIGNQNINLFVWLAYSIAGIHCHKLKPIYQYSLRNMSFPVHSDSIMDTGQDNINTVCVLYLHFTDDFIEENYMLLCLLFVKEHNNILVGKQ